MLFKQIESSISRIFLSLTKLYNSFRFSINTANNNSQKITLEEARAIAQQVCEQQGWYFSDPIKVYSGKKEWVITTNCDWRGCNVVITVSKETRELIRAGFAPR